MAALGLAQKPSSILPIRVVSLDDVEIHLTAATFHIYRKWNPVAYRNHFNVKCSRIKLIEGHRCFVCALVFVGFVYVGFCLFVLIIWSAPTVYQHGGKKVILLKRMELLWDKQRLNVRIDSRGLIFLHHTADQQKVLERGIFKGKGGEEELVHQKCACKFEQTQVLIKDYQVSR